MLQPEDLMWLYQLEPDQKVIAKKGDDQAQASLERMTEAGVIRDGMLTENGKAYREKLVNRVEELKVGVPVSQRAKNQADKAAHPQSTALGWLTGVHAKKPYITNGAVFILGKPGKEMEATEADSDFRQKMAAILNSHTAGKPEEFEELIPYAYQIADLGGMEFIWLSSKNTDPEQIFLVPVQAMYIDLIKDRYPSATFWVNPKKWATEKVGDQMVIARVTNRGMKNNIVAMVLPVQGPPKAPVFGGRLSGDVH